MAYREARFLDSLHMLIERAVEADGNDAADVFLDGRPSAVD